MATTFNKLASELCGDIEATLPALRDNLRKTKKLLSSKPETKAYLEYFILHVVPHMMDVSKMHDENLCKSGMKIMVGLEFGQIWDLIKDNNSTQYALWRYLFSMYLLAMDSNDLDDILEKNSAHRNYGQVQAVLKKAEKISNNIMESSATIAQGMMANISENMGSTSDGEEGHKLFGDNMLNNEAFEKKFLNSSFGNLAKSIADDLTPEDMEAFKDPVKLFSDAGGMKNLIDKIGGKLQQKFSTNEVNEDELMKDAQSMMNELSPMFSQMFSGMGGDGKGLNPMSMMQSIISGGNLFGGGGEKKKKKKHGHGYKKRDHVVESVGEDIQLTEQEKEMIAPPDVD